MKSLLCTLVWLFISLPASGQRTLELPYGLAFGATTDQVTEAMKKLGVEEEKAMLAGYRFFSHVPVEARFATMNMIFERPDGTMNTLIVAFEESENQPKDYEEILAELKKKYGAPDKKKKISDDEFTAQEDWTFPEAQLTLSLSRSGVSLIYDQVFPGKKR